jgi:hypothetical protein
MDLSGLKETIKGILKKIRGSFGESNGFSQTAKSLFDKTKGSFFALAAWIKDTANNAGPDKKKPLFIGFGAMAVLFLILAIAAGILRSKKQRVVPPDAAAGSLTIPMEELFIPAEPDFVPEFIFEREKRRFWSLEDIRQYWRVPDSSDRWREEIKSAVDKLMEGVP